MTAKTKAAHAFQGVGQYHHTPGMLWGQTLPVAPSTSDDFEARVEAAWRHLKAGYFAAEEHERLREVLAELITKEASIDRTMTERPE
jgi:hypothetical protein